MAELQIVGIYLDGNGLHHEFDINDYFARCLMPQKDTLKTAQNSVYDANSRAYTQIGVGLSDTGLHCLSQNINFSVGNRGRPKPVADNLDYTGQFHQSPSLGVVDVSK